MKGNVEKKSANDKDETEKIAENKKSDISRNVSREASLDLIDLPLDIINLIVDNLPPSSSVLLGLTCHVFYSLFSKQNTETPLKAPIWSLPIYSKRSDASETDFELQLHHVLKDWSGLAGYKYFNTADLYRLRHPSPLAKKMKWMDDDIFSVIRTAMSVMTMAKDTKRLKEELEFGALTKRQRKIRNSMKLAGGLFFKCPQPGERKDYLWHNLSEDERLKIKYLMQLWAPCLDSLKYEFDLHRRLRWSQYMMSSYVEWRELLELGISKTRNKEITKIASELNDKNQRIKLSEQSFRRRKMQNANAGLLTPKKLGLDTKSFFPLAASKSTRMPT
ncbi:hypothetical protein BCON_0148g00010 [Botryotinia convoluta]|uniref:F-box domain-containing protein n=1 Tax=Botryotinia convoluta TaxID=54673 RepID=A0A4Z1I653_9HELO|nr:hypothetical protein BCON_0148g00010 [Botryotinia convoluta]